MEFINDKKILDHLQNDLKLPLIAVTERHQIVVKSNVLDIKKLSEFVEPLHYYLMYIVGAIYINPK